MIGRNEESNDAHIGVIPRLCRDMFNEISERLQEAKNYLNTRDRDNVKVSKPNESMIHLDSQLSVSFFEIYNEKVYDLLSTAMNTPCRVREHPSNGAYVENLTLRSVTTYEDVLNVLEEGHRQRSTASTLMNAASSRSHAIFTLYLDQRVIDRANIPTESESLTSLQRKSKIHLIDLAGSERASSTGVSGQQLVEANNINKSLSTLGDVIKALSSPSKSSKESKHIPYRNSVLTWLLKESFSGNSRTTMLAAISPTDVSYQETLSTLKYIERVKNISTYSSRNDASIDTPQVLELKRKISELQAQLSASNSENILLKEELQQRNDMIDSLKSCSNCSEEIPTNITSILNSPMIRNDSFSISSFETSANVSSSTKDEIMSSDIRDIVCARDNQTDEKLSLTIESLDSKDIIHQQIFDNNNTDEETSTTTNYSPKSSKLMKSIKQIASTSYSIDAVREFVKQYEQRLFLAKEEKKYLVFSLQRTIIQLGEMLALQESAERDDILSYSIKRAVSILKALLQETMKGEILMQNNDEQLKHSIKNNIVTNVDTDSDEDLSLSSDNIMTTETHQNSNDFKESIYISKSQVRENEISQAFIFYYSLKCWLCRMNHRYGVNTIISFKRITICK